MVITWNKHWKKVSSKLKELGYNRTHTACRGIWTRGVETQRAHRDAAGPDWDDSEHQILVNMTKKQLDLEKAGLSATTIDSSASSTTGYKDEVLDDFFGPLLSGLALELTLDSAFDRAFGFLSGDAELISDSLGLIANLGGP